VKFWLSWIAGGIAFVLIFYGSFLGIQGWRIMHSDKMVRLGESSRVYDCIGPVHDPARQMTVPEEHLADYYLAKGTDAPAQSSWLWFPIVTWAIHLSTSSEEANRMFAALPHGRFIGFNGVAREYAGKDYCSLGAKQRQAVHDFIAMDPTPEIEAAIRGEPAA
jgi:hypothetical protein